MDAWPDDVDFKKFTRPIVGPGGIPFLGIAEPLFWGVVALYGEPCGSASVKEVGFKPVAEEWPSMYFHDKLKLLLIVSVDDLKRFGPKRISQRVGLGRRYVE